MQFQGCTNRNNISQKWYNAKGRRRSTPDTKYRSTMRHRHVLCCYYRLLIKNERLIYSEWFTPRLFCPFCGWEMRKNCEDQWNPVNGRLLSGTCFASCTRWKWFLFIDVWIFTWPLLSIFRIGVCFEHTSFSDFSCFEWIFFWCFCVLKINRDFFDDFYSV